jgi:hypothetical protein
MKKLLFIMAIALVSCEPIDMTISYDEPTPTEDICRRMWFTASMDDTIFVNEEFVICPTTLVGSEAKDSTELYWACADQDLDLESIDSTQFFFQ